MTLDNMTGITEGSYTGFCKSQLITCNRVKECNGVCPFEDALKHADKMQTMNEKHIVDHDRDWIIGCLEHDGFIHTDRFDKANQIIHEALSADTVKRVDCSNFLLWLLEEIMDEDNWELNAVANGEIIARKLKKLGLLEVKDGYYHRIFDENVWVVRCKDCRFYWGNLSEDDTDEMYGECKWDSDEMPNEDDFCSYGERREP